MQTHNFLANRYSKPTKQDKNWHPPFDPAWFISYILGVKTVIRGISETRDLYVVFRVREKALCTDGEGKYFSL